METSVTKVTKKKINSSTLVDTSNMDSLPKLPLTLGTLQFLRTAKGHSDAQIHASLDKAFAEIKKAGMELLLQRIMLYMGDVSRQHHLLKTLGIISPNGGAQERAIFRSIMRWWEKNMPENFKSNLHIFAEYTLYENLMFYQNTTDRKTGKFIKTEILFPCPDTTYSLLASDIRKGRNISLIAKHMPPFISENDTHRTTKKVVKLKKGQTEFKFRLPEKSWVKINDVVVEKGVKEVTLKAGDVISYPRAKQSFVLQREAFLRDWIKGLCKVMGWTIDEYKAFRKLQDTTEQKFSQKTVLEYTEGQFNELLDKMTAGQRMRVARMIAYKDKVTGKLVAKTKWEKFGNWYINWETNQEQIANKLRVAAVSGDENAKKELMKDYKVKSTGMQTTNLIAEMFKGELTEMQIDNTYQSMIEKMDLIANVFPIIDGSSSMDSHLVTINGVSLTRRQVVYAMAIAFSTRNPVPDLQNTFGWFSANFHVCGRSKFVNKTPNPFLDKKEFIEEVPEYKVLSPGKTFTENYNSLKSADPREIANTNMFSSIEFFVKLVQDGKFIVEDLPVALLYLTDNENNTGKSPKEAVALAASIGWHPLLIFWGVVSVPASTQSQLKNCPNSLFVGGFNEGALSQILRGIKGGAINPETELWSIYNDVRYSVLK